MATPDVDQVLRAVTAVTGLRPDAFNARIDAEIGDPLLAAFRQLAESQFPNAPAEIHHRAVHLMVIAVLVKMEAQ